MARKEGLSYRQIIVAYIKYYIRTSKWIISRILHGIKSYNHDHFWNQDLLCLICKKDYREVHC
jgi:hypothetical protein